MLLFAFLLGMMLCVLAVESTAQEPGERRRGSGPPEGRPPWMREGSQGGPPWMRGGSEGGPPGMRENRERRGGDRGDRDPRGGNDAERNERMLGMLRAMDTNGNGCLEPNEIPEYRRRFVEMTVTRMGGDPSKTIDLNSLARRAASRSGSSTPTGSASRSVSTSVKNADPLVPVFGEKEPEPTPVLEFGLREPETKTATTTRQAAVALSSSDQILRQAREIMNRYDKNKNGTLDKDKGEWVNSLSFNADKADKNRDGRISMSELIEALGGKTGGSSGAAVVAIRPSTVYDRLPPGVPDWFFQRDKNQDGQLTMLEYANDQPWNEAIADEFRFLDKNNDGVVTIAEMFETLKQVDEEKRLKEEQAKRELERRKGVGAGGQAVRKDGSNESGDSGKPEERKSEVDSSGNTPPKPPGSSEETPKPAEAPPNRSSTSVSGEIPSTAPYSSGSSGGNEGDRRRRPRRSRD